MLEALDSKTLELEYLSRGFYVEQLLDTCQYENEGDVVWTSAERGSITLGYSEVMEPMLCSFEALSPSYDSLFESIMALEQ